MRGIFQQLHSLSHRMTLIDHAYLSEFMEWHNLGIVTLEHAIHAIRVKELMENQITTDFIYLASSNIVTMSHINY